MTVEGWMVLVFSWTLILGICGYCLAKVLALKDQQAEHIKPIYEIETQEFNVNDIEFIKNMNSKEERD